MTVRECVVVVVVVVVFVGLYLRFGHLCFILPQFLRHTFSVAGLYFLAWLTYVMIPMESRGHQVVTSVRFFSLYRVH